MRYIVVIHPVVIMWLVGTLTYSDSPGSPVYIFAGECLTLLRLYLHNQCFIDTYTDCVSSFFPLRRSFDPGSVHPDAGDTCRPDHVAAPQTTVLQRRRAQPVAGGDSFDSKQVPTVKFYSSVSFFYDCLVFFIFYCALPWHRRLPASDIFVQTQSSPVIFATVNKCVEETMCKVL